MGTNEVSVALDSDISLNNVAATGSVTGAGASFTTLDIGGTRLTAMTLLAYPDTF